MEKMLDKDYIYKKLIKELPDEVVKKDEPMKKHTSFKIGGPADILVIPQNIQQLIQVLKITKQNGIIPYVIGNGTNILVTDKGIRGIIIKIANNMNKVEYKGTLITAESGALLSALSKAAMERSLTGLEFAGGIPGTLGGAVCMNAGAYGGEMKDVVDSVEVLDYEGNSKTITKEEIQFGYRTSIFQKHNLIIYKVNLLLKQGNYSEIKQRMDELSKKRKEKQPLWEPNAGSTFKRPVGSYAGYLIEKAGLKGYRIGGAQVSEIHAGFIVNKGNATAKDILMLIKHIQDTVYNKFGVKLVPEIKILGER